MNLRAAKVFTVLFLCLFGLSTTGYQMADASNFPPSIQAPGEKIGLAGSLTDLVIVIDPGHGLSISATPTGACREYDRVRYCEDGMNWNMALGARDYFRSVYPDTQVIFTHNTQFDNMDWNNDGHVTPSDRWFLANNLQNAHVVSLLGFTPKKAKADLFLSFHMNVNSDTTLSGTICYRSTAGTAATYQTQSAQFCKRVLDAVANRPKVKFTTALERNGLFFDNLDMPHAVDEAGFISNKSDAIWFANTANAKMHGQWAAYGAMNYWYFDTP